MDTITEAQAATDELVKAVTAVVVKMLPTLKPRVYLRPALRAPADTRITVDWYEPGDIRRGLMLIYPGGHLPPIAWAVESVTKMITRILSEKLEIALNARWVPEHLTVAYRAGQAPGKIREASNDG